MKPRAEPRKDDLEIIATGMAIVVLLITGIVCGTTIASILS